MDPNLVPYQESAPSMKSHVVDFIQTFIVFAAIGTVIYFFIARPHRVSGDSMKPTFLSGDYIITNEISYRLGDPKRGDVIVFKNPKNLDEDFIKRVIGLPGEKVKVEGGQVYINDQVLPESYLKNVYTNPEGFLTDGQEMVVPAGQYIVFGDNRPQSSDSRDWGFITREEIIGKVFFRYWPFNALGITSSAKY